MDTFITTEQAAERLSLHVNTVNRYIRDGRLQATKVGKGYRIKESAVLEMLGALSPSPNHHSGARIIAIANQKGGVSKTTTSVNLAACLSQLGKRVLLVDMDPQGGCAVCLGYDPDDEEQLPLTVYNLLVDQSLDINKVILKTAHGFDLLPANIDLSGAEVELSNEYARETILRRRLERVSFKYDFIIIDTPPSLNVLTVNALTAAHEVLIPVSCETLAVRGLKMLFSTIAKIQGVTNPQLRILGMLATKYTHTHLSQEVVAYLERLAAERGLKLFEPIVGNTVRVTESPNSGRPVVFLYPDLPSSQAYLQVAQEIDHA